MIPLSVPSIDGNEWQYIKECLDTAWVSSAGKYVDTFERNICNFTGAKHAVACVNGTAALHVALLVAGVKPGDEVIVPTITFIAPVNAVRYLNAYPVFMDCDDFYNLDVEKTIAFISEETEMRDGCSYDRATGRRVSAIVPVHVFGNAADLTNLQTVCCERNIKIIEDASESLGSRYKQDVLQGRHTGTVGDIGCLSFNGNKIMTTGGGGMLLTDNAEYAQRARYLTTQAKDDDVHYVHNAVGYNYRMTNVAAAMGVAQLEKIPDFIETKLANYGKYRTAIADIPGLSLAPVPNYADSNYWFYCLQIDSSVYGRYRDTLLNDLAGKGIQSRPVWVPNHLQRPYKDCRHYKIERAIDLWQKTLNIPCSVELKDEQINEVIEALKYG